jgi:hypothetical protein
MENYIYEGQAYDENYDLDVFATTQSPEQPRQKKRFLGLRSLAFSPEILTYFQQVSWHQPCCRKLKWKFLLDGRQISTTNNERSRHYISASCICQLYVVLPKISENLLVIT